MVGDAAGIDIFGDLDREGVTDPLDLPEPAFGDDRLQVVHGRQYLCRVVVCLDPEGILSLDIEKVGNLLENCRNRSSLHPIL